MTELNSSWRARLIDAALLERGARGHAGVAADALHPTLEAAHKAAGEILNEAFDALGWTGRAKVGDDGAAAAMLILQQTSGHPALQRRALTLILEAIPNGDAHTLDAAFLADRIAVFEGQGQTFGTQFDWDDAGLLSPAPVRDPETLDQRRATVGLPPIADSIAEMRAQDAPAPTDLAERREAFAIWAKSVGWR
jgi:hypothetical protein